MKLVTGATGLLGSHLLLELAQDASLTAMASGAAASVSAAHAGGWNATGTPEIVALKRPGSDLEAVRRVFSYALPPEHAEGAFGSIRWEDCDLEDYDEVLGFVEQAEQIYHCAARVSFQPKEAEDMIRFNTESTARLVDACLACSEPKRLLHVSSSSAIGKTVDGTPATENKIYTGGKGSSAYSLSKFRSEMEVWRGIEEGLDALIVNPGIILGPGHWDREGSSSIMHRVAGGMKYGTPGMTGYVGIWDVAPIMRLLMKSDIRGERFILSEGDYSYAEVFEMMAAALGQPRTMKSVRPSVLHWLARLDGIREKVSGKRSLTPEQAASAFHRSRFSSEKIRKTLNWQFLPLPEVIQEMAEIYRKDHPLN